MQQREMIHYDALAIGATRPPMTFGVPQTFAFLNLVCSAITGLILSTWLREFDLNLLGLLSGPLLYLCLHMIALYCAQREPRFVEIYLKWFSHTPPVLNVRFWNTANSYEPW